MKKKEAEDVQENGSKSRKKMDLKKYLIGSDNRERSARTGKLTDDPRFAQAVQNYEAGLAALQAHKYDRAAVHLNTCVQLLNRDSATFKTPEERYDYAVSLMNLGDYVGAREIFEELTKKHPKLDFVWYGSAALNCLMGHFPDAIAGLNEAIRLNPTNRFQARNDSDFKSLADDPRFTELLYPDTSADVQSDAQKWHF